MNFMITKMMPFLLIFALVGFSTGCGEKPDYICSEDETYLVEREDGTVVDACEVIPHTDPACLDQCEEHEICDAASEKCVQVGCAEECEEGEVCDKNLFKCIPALECDPECEGEQICNPHTGECEDPPPPCGGPCPDGKVCNEETDECELICDPACGEDEACNEETGECEPIVECPVCEDWEECNTETGECEQVACHPACRSWEMCDGDTWECVSTHPCGAPCAEGEFCDEDAGVCEPYPVLNTLSLTFGHEESDTAEMVNWQTATGGEVLYDTPDVVFELIEVDQYLKVVMLVDRVRIEVDSGEFLVFRNCLEQEAPMPDPDWWPTNFDEEATSSANYLSSRTDPHYVCVLFSLE